MEQLTLSAEPRVGLGSISSSKVRKQGLIPAVMYSEGEEATAISVSAQEFSKILDAKQGRSIFALKSEDAGLNGSKTIIKSLQKEPVKGRILHIDFLNVKPGYKVKTKVPLKVVGESPAVKQKIAVLNVAIREVEVSSLPENIPAELVLDVSSLAAGQSMFVDSLTLPEGVVVVTGKKVALVTAKTKRGVSSQEESADKPAAAKK